MTLISRISSLITSIGVDIKALYGRSLPPGGATGQVLKKTSGTHYDVSWQNESGVGGGGTQNVFIQDTEPTVTVESLWIDTTNGNYEFYIKTP